MHYESEQNQNLGRGGSRGAQSLSPCVCETQQAPLGKLDDGVVSAVEPPVKKAPLVPNNYVHNAPPPPK